MHLLELRDKISQPIMLDLAQQGVRDIGRYVAATGALTDLCGKPLRDGGGQLLGAVGFAHTIILPLVGFHRTTDVPVQHQLFRCSISQRLERTVAAA